MKYNFPNNFKSKVNYNYNLSKSTWFQTNCTTNIYCHAYILCWYLCCVFCFEVLLLLFWYVLFSVLFIVVVMRFFKCFSCFMFVCCYVFLLMFNCSYINMLCVFVFCKFREAVSIGNGYYLWRIVILFVLCLLVIMNCGYVLFMRLRMHLVVIGFIIYLH